jgi:hypothetical protein
MFSWLFSDHEQFVVEDGRHGAHRVDQGRSAGVVQPVERVPGTTREPGPGVAEHAVVAQIAAPPGALPLEGLQPPAPQAIGQGDP